MTITTAWREPAAIDAPRELIELVGHRLGAELLLRRGLGHPDLARPFLDPAARAVTSRRDIPGIEPAIARLRRAVERRERVLVWGDFDVDGQSSTAVLVLALRRLRLDPAWHVPTRATDSHGLNESCLELAAREGATLLVTCDCGIGDDGHVCELASAGIDAIVTDHHAMPVRLRDRPHPAHALVWPGALAEEHVARRLAGVGVAYCLAAELLESFGESGEDLLDLVALGTVADVAPLLGENRYLAQRGLPALNKGKRPGIKAMLSLAGRLGAAPMDASVAGWIIAPPLNAFGRLGKAGPAVELMMSEDEATIGPIASDAHTLNQTRQSYCEQIVAAATEMVEGCLDGRAGADAGPCLVSESAIVAAHPDWHLGVIGLAAGRLAGAYLRPVALATRDQDGRGRVSVRSAPWCDLNDVVAELVADPALDFRGGSHPAAAGGTLPWENVATFAKAFDRAADRQRPMDSQVRVLEMDAELRLGDATLEACRAIGRLAPFGNGNPAPLLLLRGVRLSAPPRQMGHTQRHLRLALAGADGIRGSALWWDAAKRPIPAGPVDLCLSMEESAFNGEVEPRLVVEDVRSATGTPSA